MGRLLFHSPRMETLAKKVKALNQFQEDLKLGQIDWKKFADGFPDNMIVNAHKIKSSDVIFLASFDTPATIFNQLSVIYALPRYLAKSLKVFLPYYPTGTMERVETQGQIATAMTLARMLSASPMTQTGPVQFIIFDIHALQEQFYFSDQVLVRLETAINLIDAHCPKDEFAVAFPDEGARKRFGRFFPGYYKIICDKIRDGDKRYITIKEGDPSGRKIILIDDLIQTGGTLIQCAKTLLENGADVVLAYAPHGVFPKGWPSFIEKMDNSIKKVFITDSIPQGSMNLPDGAVGIEDTQMIETLSLAPLINKIINE
ncbi:ribose-phosphate pyrophosphokinase-like domain-containing protein [Patescibacteria group bacterium]